MSLQQFVTPTDEQWVDALGVIPESIDGKDRVYRLNYQTNSGDNLDFVFDIFGNSIKVRWDREGELLATVFREGASLLRADSGAGEAYLTIDFHTDGLDGQLIIRVLPSIRISDKLLFS